MQIFRTVKKVLIFLFVVHLVYLIMLRWVDPPFTITQAASLLGGQGLKRDYVSYDEISANMKLAVIASEDQIFADHNGFDFKSIRKAMAYNEKKPGRIRGGSTISQQVAKNVFLWQGRSWFRKGLEVYFTFMIELVWSKERILQMYLNVAETGKGIFGVEAASQAYFRKPATKLTRQEASLIAAALPSPKKYSVRPPSAYVSTRSRWIQKQMSQLEGDEDIKKIIGR